MKNEHWKTGRAIMTFNNKNEKIIISELINIPQLNKQPFVGIARFKKNEKVTQTGWVGINNLFENHLIHFDIIDGFGTEKIKIPRSDIDFIKIIQPKSKFEKRFEIINEKLRDKKGIKNANKSK